MGRFSIKFICVLLLSVLAGGCTIRTTLDNLKPPPVVMPAEKITGKYAVSVRDVRGRELVATMREGNVGYKMIMTVPFGDTLAQSLENNIKQYLDDARILSVLDSRSVLELDEDGIIEIQLRQTTTQASYNERTSSERTAYTAVTHEADIVLRRNFGREIRRQVSLLTSGYSNNKWGGVFSLASGSLRDAMEKSISAFTGRLLTEIGSMIRESNDIPAS